LTPPVSIPISPSEPCPPSVTRKRDAHPRRRTEDATGYQTFGDLDIDDDSSIGN
jgi:hypothetical protein